MSVGSLAIVMLLAAPPTTDVDLSTVKPVIAADAQTTDINPVKDETVTGISEPVDDLVENDEANSASAGSPTVAFSGPQSEAIEPDLIVVTARPHDVPGDPLQSVNVTSFEAVQAVDDAFVGPVSMAYKDSVPGPVRRGLRNFLNNLQQPVIFLNYLLQLKPGKAAETLGRFAVNSTIGVAGLIDVAKKRPFNLPHRPNGFAYTLGFYGVKPGPYLYLPLIGPTTIRDLAGRSLDLFVLPFSVGKPFTHPAYSISTTTFRGLDDRAEANDELNAMRNETADPYTALRDAYMHKRQAEIDELRGKPSNSAVSNAKECDAKKFAPQC